MIDIREGDILAARGHYYQIRNVSPWATDGVTLSKLSFGRLATVTAHTLRSPAITGGKRGEAVINLPEIHCTPLDPVSQETARRLAIDTPYNLLETFVDSPPADDPGGPGFLHLILEDTRV